MNVLALLRTDDDLSTEAVASYALVSQKSGLVTIAIPPSPPNYLTLRIAIIPSMPFQPPTREIGLPATEPHRPSQRDPLGPWQPEILAASCKI